MHIDSKHLLKEAEYHPSPHRCERTAKKHPCLVVLHSVGLPPGDYGTDAVRQHFLGGLDCDSHPFFDSLRNSKVSAHIFIRRDGSLLQFVPFNKAAWHAGRSSYKGQKGCNSFSIGIELEGSEREGYEDIQYEKLLELSLALISKYPYLNANTFAGHKDVAEPHGRKSDPWNFDWQRFRSLLRDAI